MSKTLWHTIQIKVPKEMLELTKSGKVSIKKTLTKTLNISRSQKKPAIKLIPSDVNKPHIVNDGKEWNIDVLKERMAKARAMRKKNANKNVFEPVVKKMNPILEGNIIQRARELGEAKKNEFRTRVNNQVHLNRRTKKGRAEYYNINEQKAELKTLGQEQSKIMEKGSWYGFISNDDALKFVELSKKENAIDKTQPIAVIKGNKFPKLVKLNKTILFVVKENYPEEKQREEAFFNKLSRNELIM